MSAIPILGTILAGVVATTIAVPPLRHLAARFGWIDRPRPDRHHQNPVPLLGGAAVLIGIASGIGVWTLSIPRPYLPGAEPGRITSAVLVGTIAFFVLGLADDRKSLAAVPKALVQGAILALALFLWRPEGLLHDPLALTIAWISGMLVLNAWNYLDHVDGIFSGVIAVGAVIMALAGTAAMQEPRWLALFWALAGAALGFLLWNLPPARIFLGDGGSLPLGFILVGASWFLIDRGDRIALPAALAANAVPLADLALVTIVRLGAGRNPFVGGREHTGHRLTLRHGAITAFLIPVAAAALFGAIAFFLGLRRPGTAAIVISLGMAAFAWAAGRLPTPVLPDEAVRGEGLRRSGRPRGRRGV